MYAGVDEAGRGPVLGPLVVAGVLGSPDDLPEGVADSKTLSPDRREQLASDLRGRDGLSIVRRSITAARINDRMAGGATLDTIETEAFASVIDELGADEAVTDVVGSDADAFGRRLTERLDDGVRVEARPGADAEDPMVGAASIVAKVHRDAALDRIAEEVGEPVGSGYPSDPTTRRFLEDWRQGSPEPPPFARRAWSTLTSLGFGGRRLDDFDDGGSPT